jgi:hypothetical protein
VACFAHIRLLTLPSAVATRCHDQGFDALLVRYLTGIGLATWQYGRIRWQHDLFL